MFKRRLLVEEGRKSGHTFPQPDSSSRQQPLTTGSPSYREMPAATPRQVWRWSIRGKDNGTSFLPAFHPLPVSSRPPGRGEERVFDPSLADHVNPNRGPLPTATRCSCPPCPAVHGQGLGQLRHIVRHLPWRQVRARGRPSTVITMTVTAASSSKWPSAQRGRRAHPRSPRPAPASRAPDHARSRHWLSWPSSTGHASCAAPPYPTWDSPAPAPPSPSSARTGRGRWRSPRPWTAAPNERCVGQEAAPKADVHARSTARTQPQMKTPVATLPSSSASEGLAASGRFPQRKNRREVRHRPQMDDLDVARRRRID